MSNYLFFLLLLLAVINVPGQTRIAALPPNYIDELEIRGYISSLNVTPYDFDNSTVGRNIKARLGDESEKFQPLPAARINYESEKLIFTGEKTAVAICIIKCTRPEKLFCLIDTLYFQKSEKWKLVSSTALGKYKMRAEKELKSSKGKEKTENCRLRPAAQRLPGCRLTMKIQEICGK